MNAQHDPGRESRTGSAGENLGTIIYNALAAALVRGALRPDERLKIRDIARQMGTSVTPVRDAILRLVQEGALYLRSPRDIRVTPVSPGQYLELRAIRIELEGKAAEMAAEHATADDLKQLDRLVRENERALRAGDHGRATDLNQLFHFHIAQMSGMPVLVDILRRLWMRMGPWISESYDMTDPQMVAFHRNIVAAIRNHDPQAARAAMRDDLVIAGGALLDNMNRLSEHGPAIPGTGTAAVGTKIAKRVFTGERSAPSRAASSPR
jgi:DNA-binding GntR family transcriptional regulator